MAPAALPAASNMIRPAGGCGSSGGRQAAGCAAATAARNSVSRKARESDMRPIRPVFRAYGKTPRQRLSSPQRAGVCPMDDKTRTELEAAVYRRLVEHLRARTDVQNIDMMNLAGFCRNCLSNWMKDAADEKGVAMSKDESRQIVYGMPYDEWRKQH